MKVVIIGAGVAGLSIGWRLRQAGAEVVVLERAQPALGATWAAAGMISSAKESSGNPAFDALGRAAVMRWPEFAAEVEAASGTSVGYRRDGSLVIARTDAELDQLNAIAANSPDASMLSPVECRALEPILPDNIRGALSDPTEAQVDNRSLGSALVHAFLRAGGQLQANETVVCIENDRAGVWGVRTPFALHQGDAYVLAAGAWTSQIEGLPAGGLPEIIPVKGEMIALSGSAPPSRVIWGNDVYLVPRNNAIFVGATVVRTGFDTALTEQAKLQLYGKAVELVPALTQWKVTDHWAGLRPGSPDDLPILGRSSIERLFIASGQYRNGILLAPAIADCVSALVLAKESPIDLAAFDPGRFLHASLATPWPVR